MDQDAASERFQSFKMGGGAPPNSLQSFSRHSHTRSHSRNRSISSVSSSPSLPVSVPDSPPLNPSLSLNLPPKRPSSHHHRRSSVSTRRESAELMGVSLPDLPPAHSDDNLNLGDRDSIRRRALWALEGKPDLASPKVEIPDITCTIPFEFPTKPSFPPGSGTTSFPGKRDSFGKMFGSGSASKDQLGTLIEEEEEEEDLASRPAKDPRVNQGQPPKSTRHRPASLNLRPLSLVQGNVASAVTSSLPTPTLTPATSSNARNPGILPSLDDAISINFSPMSSCPTPSRRFSYSLSDSFSIPSDLDKKRRSSISYKRSTDATPRDMFPLPSPEITPTEHRFALGSDQGANIQPLSVAEQHFLFQSHHALLSRITELERTLRNRASQSQHVSFASEASVPFSAPNDEMLRLISDLKAERDELKRDVDGWRQRVADADKHATILAKRIEAERREAWVARSRLGLLEVEKSGLEKSLETKTAALSQSMIENTVLSRERDRFKDEVMKLDARLKDAETTIDECTRLRAALEQERARRKELEKLLDDAGLLNTPKLANGACRRHSFHQKPVGIRPRGLGFQSVDSESSTTDVESVDDSFTKAEFTLDAVAEEEGEFADDDNGLAGYEDEDDSDVSFSSPGGSSIGSADEFDVEADRRSISPSKSIHQSRASLSKTWTFPRGKTATSVKNDDEVDRFFGCLEDNSGSPPLSDEMSQIAFSSAFQSMCDDELPPFFIPPDIGVVVESTSRDLDVVPEEEEYAAGTEEDFHGEAVEGGIRFTFNPPPVICVTPPDLCATPPPEIRVTSPEEVMTTPAVRPRAADSKPVLAPELIDEDDEDESALTLVFPPKTPPRPVGYMTSSPPSHPNNRTESPPSSIPRAVSLRSMSPKTPAVTFTPSKSISGRSTTSTGTSPPAKKLSSSIPQPATLAKFPAPTRAVIPSKQSQAAPSNGSTFKPHSKLFMPNDSMSAFRCPSSTQSGGATTKVNGNHQSPSSSSICQFIHAQDTLSIPFVTSNPLAARSPLQKLSHFMSFSWAPGAATVASYIVPSSLGGSCAEAADSTDVGIGATRPGQQRYVSRARQLEKLKSRLDLERMPLCSAVGACKGCSAGDVCL